MSEPLLDDLRAAKPVAPTELRERVRALAATGARARALSRPAPIHAGMAPARARRAGHAGRRARRGGSDRAHARRRRRSPSTGATGRREQNSRAGSETAHDASGAARPSARGTCRTAASAGGARRPVPGRLQRYEAELRLRVDDVDALSSATKARSRSRPRTAAASPRSGTTRPPRAWARRDHAASPDRRGRARAAQLSQLDDPRPALRDRGYAAAGRHPPDPDRGDAAPDRADP